MNRIFRIIWSQVLNTWVAVSELAPRCGKCSGGADVDERTVPRALILDRDRVEGSPPAATWPLRMGSLLALWPGREASRVSLSMRRQLVAVLLGAVIAPAQAVDYYWDINGNLVGSGGVMPSGAWSTTDLTLTTDVNGNLVVVPQTTTTSDRLFFSAGADATGTYTVTVNGIQDIGRLSFEDGAVTLTGGTINFGGVTGRIDANAITDTIASPLTGTNGIGFAGGSAGSLRLTGTNTYTGTSNVATHLILAASGGNALSGNLVQLGNSTLSTTGGSITLNAANQINDAATVFVFAENPSGNQAFSLNGFNETIAGLSMRRDGTFSTATLRNGAATDATLTLTGSSSYNAGIGNSLSGRSITDGGGGKLHLVIALAGTGSQVISGTSANYTGTTTITSGTLRLLNTSTWASNVTLNGGTLILDQVSVGTAFYAGAGTRTHTNTIGGTGGQVLKLGDGTVILSGPNAYRGSTRILSGTLQAGSSSAFGIDSAVTISGPGTLNLNGFNNSIGSLAQVPVASAGTVQLGSATLTTGGNNASTVFGGVISGSGNLIKLGTGTQSLSGTNTYTGTTTINDGTLRLGFVGPFGAGDGLTGTLGAGAVSIGATGTLAFNRANLHTVNNTISGAGTLAQVGLGATTLTAVSSVGNTTVSAGTLDIDGVLNTGTVMMGNGIFNVDGTVQASGLTQAVIGNVAGTASTVRIGSAGTLLANGDLGDGNDTLDVFGTLNTGAGALLLGDGDDNFIIHDATNAIGAVVGGMGVDTYIYDIAGIANVSALSEFEGLTKRGVGTVNLTGPGVTDLANVRVEQGTLNVQAGASVVAQATGSLNTLVAAGTIFNVDGSYTASTHPDTFDVAGTVGGSGTINLNDGDDTLILHDGANLGGLVNAIDGGDGLADAVIADLTGVATLGGAVNFETLTKTHTGTLNINGPAASAFSVVDVKGGTLDIGVDGRIDGVVTATVASGATLNVQGRLTGTSGDDTMDVAGTVSGSGRVGLEAGNDTLTLREGANIGSLVSAIDGGAGVDTVSADVASTMALGPTVNFEALRKTGVGRLTLIGDQAYAGALVHAGTATIATGAVLRSQDTTVAAGAILDVQGRFSGTEDDDRFTSSGTVIGALGFADGNDTVAFNGGDVSGVTAVDGGAGGSDRLSFSGQNFDGNDFALAGWERVDLSNASAISLSGAFTFGGGVLAIDATSRLVASAGTSIDGGVENAGRITLGANRLAILGGYHGNSGTLQLQVSPGRLSSGGLSIGGDVTGTTFVAFTSDGTDVLRRQAASILVISSANDNVATAGRFMAADAHNGYTRLTGSLSPWSFGQHDDHNWYLDAVAGLLPETAGYAALSGIGQAQIQDSSRQLFQRMGAVRSDTLPCSADDGAAWGRMGDCSGTWVAVSGSELKMGANPGFAFSGDSVGVYVGVDGVLQEREMRTFRGGLFAGFLRGNYWTTGVNSTELPGIGESNVHTDTPTFGMYGSFNWRGGSDVDVSLVAQLPKATVTVADGFHEAISGNSLTLSAQVGHRFALGKGWIVEPQVQLSASAMQWGDQVDASGKRLVLDDDVLGTVRVAVEAQKGFESKGGARVRPWARLGLQDTVGEKAEAVGFTFPGNSVRALPNHELGLTATLEVGIEAEVTHAVSLYGALSYGESIEGSDAEQRQANLGVRIRW